ncbi:MAG TPA: endo-1,4-beta-xylanase [Bryobacteraceae bacterium]|nr:endo-1,4-beta-xylanase [Bryobacteraceae bacterium]
MGKWANTIGFIVLGISPLLVLGQSNTAPAIQTSAALPAAVMGVAYSASLSATGTAPIGWQTASGSLPAGIALAASGILSGTPTATGKSTFTLRATNGYGTQSRQFSIQVGAAPSITTLSLANGITSAAYSQRVTATGTTPLTWSITGGALPAGLSWNGTSGAITGTPSTAGAKSLTVTATNAYGRDSAPFTITVGIVPAITTTAFAPAPVGIRYSQKLAATGSGPIAWSIYNGALPSGLTLTASSGLISGTPGVSGSSAVWLAATNEFGVAKVRLVLTVMGPISVAVAPLTAAVAPSQAQNFTAAVGNATDDTVTWSLSPAVGQIASNGTYTAPANVTDQVAVTVTATSSQNKAKSASVNMVLLPGAGGAATLRGAARSRILIGSAASGSEVTPDPLTDPRYAATLTTQYNMLGPENALKWTAIHPTQNSYNFGSSDELVAFAQANGMAVRGHNLCWYAANPAWLTQLATTATPATMSQLLAAHIAAVVGRYKGKIFAWDVVNEAVSDNATGVGPGLQDSIWYNQPGIGLTGTGYIEQAFRWAHAADPNALLFYNDYGIEGAGPKFQSVYNLVAALVADGVPINGVGMQMHLDTSGYPTMTDLAANIQKLAALGLQVHITEMDVRLPVTSSGVATTANLQAQKSIYSEVLQVCLASPNCTAFQTWEFSDKYSWIQNYYTGYGAALPFDANDQAKPAFDGLLSALEAAPPILSANAVVDAVSNSAGTIVPGELIAIRLPRSQPGRFQGQVLFDGIAAPILYSTESEVGVAVPYAIAGRQQTSVKFTDGTGSSNAVTIIVGR